jgi:hypothetical protein
MIPLCTAASSVLDPPEEEVEEEEDAVLGAAEGPTDPDVA